MRQARPPRGRVLILALGAVLVLMGLAFWRAVAGSRAPEAAKASAPAATVAANDAGASIPAPAPPPAPVPPTAAEPPRPAALPGPGALPAGMDEAHLMARLRAMKDSDPPGAVTLAREGNRRFPDSGDAPERTSILIHALVAADKGSEARGEAEQMVNHYPDSTWVREIERFTGAHRHRNVSVNDAGQVIFR